MKWIKDSLVGMAVALLLTVTPTFGSPETAVKPSGLGTKWSWFEKTQGNAQVDSIKVWSRCLAEDSAAHLALKRYEAGTAVYGCQRGGY